MLTRILSYNWCWGMSKINFELTFKLVLQGWWVCWWVCWWLVRWVLKMNFNANLSFQLSCSWSWSLSLAKVSNIQPINPEIFQILPHVQLFKGWDFLCFQITLTQSIFEVEKGSLFLNRPDIDWLCYQWATQAKMHKYSAGKTSGGWINAVWPTLDHSLST